MSQKSGLRNKSFSMISRLEMILLVVYYERKNINFYEQDSKITENNTFNNAFGNRIIFY